MENKSCHQFKFKGARNSFFIFGLVLILFECIFWFGYHIQVPYFPLMLGGLLAWTVAYICHKKCKMKPVKKLFK